MQRGKIFAQVLVIGMLALGSQLLTAGRAAAYDFRICSNFGAVYIHVHTVSALCHDRTPVDYSDKPLTAIGGCVRGTTAPGCLIDGVTIVPYYATIPRKEYNWAASVWPAARGISSNTFSEIPLSVSTVLATSVLDSA